MRNVTALGISVFSLQAEFKAGPLGQLARQFLRLALKLETADLKPSALPQQDKPSRFTTIRETFVNVDSTIPYP